MSKKIIPFPLVMKNGAKVKTVEELRANADIESIMSHYVKGSLSRWCTAFHYDDIITETDNITEQIVRKLYEVLQIDVNEDELKQYLKNKTVIADDGDDEIQEDEKIEEVKNEQKETEVPKAPASSINDFVFVEDHNPAFYICDHAVTQGEYQMIMGDNPSTFKGFNNPVEYVYFYQMIDYCNKRSKKEGLTPCYKKDKYKDVYVFNFNANGYRLPTCEEWAFAASGGNLSEGYKYSGSDNLDEVAWYKDNSGGHSHPVKKKKPNELGIYDMSGNVWELCCPTKDLDATGYGLTLDACGGNCLSAAMSNAKVLDFKMRLNNYCCYEYLGFRVVRTAKK